MIDNLDAKINPQKEQEKTWYSTRKHLLVNFKLDRPFLHMSKKYKELLTPNIAKRLADWSLQAQGTCDFLSPYPRDICSTF